MPALYVSNPRDSKGRFKKARKASTGGGTHKRKKAKGPRRSNPATQQPLILVAPAPKQTRRRKATTTGRTTSKTPRKPRRKRIGTAAPKPGRKWAYKRASNPRGRNGRFMARGRRRGGTRRRRNALTISNPAGGIPVIGTAMVMIVPAFFGAAGVELIGQARKMVAKVVTIPAAVEPFEFTIGGLLLAGVVQLLWFLPANIRHGLGIGLASGGAAVDWHRYRSESNAYGQLDMGDGGQWEVETLGDAEAYGALDLSGIDFSGDEDLCGPDFSVDEGNAMAEGYGVYLTRFPIKKHPRAARMDDRPRRGTPAHEIHDGRREGDRFHWLAQVFDAEDLRKLANMEPKKRLAQLRACKAEFKRIMEARRRRRGEDRSERPAQRMIAEDMETPPITPSASEGSGVRVDPFSQGAF